MKQVVEIKIVISKKLEKVPSHNYKTTSGLGRGHSYMYNVC